MFGEGECDGQDFGEGEGDVIGTIDDFVAGVVEEAFEEGCGEGCLEDFPGGVGGFEGFEDVLLEGGEVDGGVTDEVAEGQDVVGLVGGVFDGEG